MTTPSPVIDPVQPVPRPRRRVWPWVALALAVLIPVMLTLAGALTSPPRVAGPPIGRIVFLDANQTSERTTLLRGLSVLTPDGQSRLLVHEQDSPDAEGAREWITQPAASPDGRQVAFIKQLITLKEEDRSVVNQLWVMPLDGNGKPKMLLDLTARKLKQIVGLAWTPDSKDIVFLHDLTAYEIRVSDGRIITRSIQPWQDSKSPQLSPSISATRNPSMLSVLDYGPMVIYTIQTATGIQLSFNDVPSNPGNPLAAEYYPVRVNGGDIQAVTSDGTMQAQAHGKSIEIFRTYGQIKSKTYAASWGWSLFGGRKITSLKWSPDGKYLGYTVSKPPVPEDELFYLELATGKIFQLPARCGRAAWDWSR